MTAFLVSLVCYLGMIASAYTLGFISARQRISDAVFRPWLTSQRVNSGAIYWLRARDYAAAWRAYDTANLPFLRGRFSEARTFSDEPEFAVEVRFTADALASYERKSHGSSTGRARQVAE